MAVFLNGGGTVSTSTPAPWSAPFESMNGAHPLTEYFRNVSFEELYKCQPSVRKVIDKRASLGGLVPFKAYRRTSSGRESARSSAFGRLTSQPSQEMSQHDWHGWFFRTHDIHGIAFGLIARDEVGRPVEVVPVSPRRMRYGKPEGKAPLERESRWTDSELNTGNTWFLRLSPEREIHFPRRDLFIWKEYNPSYPFWGLSKLESLLTTLEDDAAARCAMEMMWKQGARPNFVLKAGGSMEMHPAVIDQVKNDAQESLGGLGNWWKPLVLEDGMDIETLPFADGLEYLGLRKLTDLEVGAVFDLSGAIIHNHERSTFNNIHEIYQDVFRSVMAHVLGSFEAAWNHDVRDGRHGAGGPPNFPEGLYAEHDTAGVLRGSAEAVISAGSTQLQTGQLTVNEFRELQNRPPVEGGDVLLINAALVPLTEASRAIQPGGSSTGLDAPGDEADGAPVTVPLSLAEGVDLPAPTVGLSGQRAASVVMGRLSRVEVADIDVGRLVEGLSPGASRKVREAVAWCVIEDGSVERLRSMIKDLELSEL